MQTSYGAGVQASSGATAAQAQPGYQPYGTAQGAPPVVVTKDGKPIVEREPLPAIKLDLGDLRLTMTQDGVWKGGPSSGGGSSEEDAAEIRRLRGELDALRDKLRSADDERALLDFKNKLLVEMVRKPCGAAPTASPRAEPRGSGAWAKLAVFLPVALVTMCWVEGVVLVMGERMSCSTVVLSAVEKQWGLHNPLHPVSPAPRERRPSPHGPLTRESGGWLHASAPVGSDGPR